VLVLDAGNSLVSDQPVTAPSEGRIPVEGMNRLGYDAMTVGDQDFRWGVAAVQQRMAEAKFPFLSANVFAGNSQQLLAQPYIIKEMSGHRVAIIGVTGKNAPSFLPQGGSPEPLLVADPVETVRRTIADLTGKATVFILLSNLSFQQDQQLAAQVPGIALIVGGNPGTLMPEPYKEPTHGTLIIQAGYLGEWLGRLMLQIDEKGKVTSHSSETVPLGPDFADDPEIRAWLDSLKTTQ